MKFWSIILGLILAIIGYGFSNFTLPTIAWQTTQVLFWKVNVPVPSTYQPLAFLTVPLYFLAAICILYGIFARGEPK